MGEPLQLANAQIKRHFEPGIICSCAACVIARFAVEQWERAEKMQREIDEVMTLAELISKLEAAEKGNRELDAEIASALGLTVIKAVLPASPENWRVQNPKQPPYVTWELRHYTATPESRAAAIAALQARGARL